MGRLPVGGMAARPHISRDGLRVASVAIDPAALPQPVADLVAALVPRHADHCLALLPDDAVFASTPYEAEIVAAELASDDGYLSHAWGLPPRPTVLDIGAHIGLFTLDVARRYPGARVVAAEPFGPSYAALVKNVRLHGYQDSVRVVNAAVSDRAGTAEISGCRGAPLVASTTPGRGDLLARTRDTLLARLPRLLNRGSWPSEVTEWAAAAALGWLFGPERHRVRRCTVGDLMTRYRLRRVSLLKVDVEGHETRVLDGISAQAWAAIDAVALETARDLLPEVSGRLVRQGFRPVVSASTMATRWFGGDSVIVRARRGPLDAGPPPAVRPVGRFGAAVTGLTTVYRTALGLGRRFWPSGPVLVDACLGDPAAAPGPLFLPWSAAGEPGRPLRDGESWARHFLARYVAPAATGGPELGEELTRVFGGEWSSAPGLTAGQPPAGVVAARLAADQLIRHLVRATLQPTRGGLEHSR